MKALLFIVTLLALTQASELQDLIQYVEYAKDQADEQLYK